MLGETKVEAVARELLDGDEALKQLKFNLVRAQRRCQNMRTRGGNIWISKLGNGCFSN